MKRENQEEILGRHILIWSVAYMVKVIDWTQNAGEFGNFLKVSSMRLRGGFMPIYCENNNLLRLKAA